MPEERILGHSILSLPKYGGSFLYSLNLFHPLYSAQPLY